MVGVPFLEREDPPEVLPTSSRVFLYRSPGFHRLGVERPGVGLLAEVHPAEANPRPAPLIRAAPARLGGMEALSALAVGGSLDSQVTLPLLFPLDRLRLGFGLGSRAPRPDLIDLHLRELGCELICVLGPKLKGSAGEGPNHSNYSDRSSVKIL